MKDSRSYSVFPSNLNYAETFRRLRDRLGKMKVVVDPAPNCTGVKFSMDVNGQRNLETSDFDEFLGILDEYPYPKSVYIHSHWKSDNSFATIELHMYLNSIKVEIDSGHTTLGGLHDGIREVFQMSNPEPKKSSTIPKNGCKRSVFVAHRFDSSGDAASESLCAFLRQAGYSVLDGQGYEARDIPEKVAERISSQDVFILLATPGESAWILSEAAYAKGHGKYIVILVEDGTVLNKGIIGGDFEHISFPPGIVEKAFTHLLYALP